MCLGKAQKLAGHLGTDNVQSFIFRAGLTTTGAIKASHRRFATRIERFAEWYASTSPAVVKCGWGQERNRNGGGSSMAILALPAVAGKFGVRGGGYAMSNSNAWGIERTWIREQEPATRLVNMNQLGRALTEYQWENGNLKTITTATGETRSFEGWSATLIPAGHVLGSAQLLYQDPQGTLLYTGDFKADYGDPKTRFRHTFDYHVRYGKVDNVPSANNMNGLIRTEFDIAKKIFIFNAAGAGYDHIRKIDFSYEDSFGIGYTLIKMTNFVLSVDGGVNYQKQFFSNGQEPEVFSPRLGEKSSWKISSKFEVSQTFEFYPRSGDFEDYRLRAEGILRYLLNDHISLNLRVAEIYDTRPAPGVTPNDLQINSTIGFRF
jgi:hypothetical protein